MERGRVVAHVIEDASRELGRVGISGARLDARWILGSILGVSATKLILQANREISASELSRFRVGIRRRLRREPLQYILGSAVFCGIELAVDARALIPRPETEQLAEMVWEAANALSPLRPSILDWGVGSGALSIAVAKGSAGCRVLGIDGSERALSLARANRDRLGLRDRVTMNFSLGFERLAPERRFDLIVTNPPYIPSDEIEELQPEIREYEPWMALDGGPDGLRCYREIAAIGRSRLVFGGQLFGEFGDGQAAALTRVFREAGWRDVRIERDMAGDERFLVARN